MYRTPLLVRCRVRPRQCRSSVRSPGADPSFPMPRTQWAEWSRLSSAPAVASGDSAVGALVEGDVRGDVSEEFGIGIMIGTPSSINSVGKGPYARNTGTINSSASGSHLTTSFFFSMSAMEARTVFVTVLEDLPRDWLVGSVSGIRLILPSMRWILDATAAMKVTNRSRAHRSSGEVQQYVASSVGGVLQTNAWASL